MATSSTSAFPPGVETGNTLRLQGQGPGGADLHLKLKIEPHPFFRREGNDVIVAAPCRCPRPSWAASSTCRRWTAPSSPSKCRPGTSSGARLRLRGKGIKGGDQYIEIKVVVPTPSGDHSRELIEEFARLNPQNPRSGPPWI